MIEQKKYTKEEVLAWAQAIYDLRGVPPYTVLQIHPQADDRQDSERQKACYQAEVALLTDFMAFWMPYVKKVGGSSP